MLSYQLWWWDWSQPMSLSSLGTLRLETDSAQGIPKYLGSVVCCLKQARGHWRLLATESLGWSPRILEDSVCPRGASYPSASPTG